MNINEGLNHEVSGLTKVKPRGEAELFMQNKLPEAKPRGLF